MLEETRKESTREELKTPYQKSESKILRVEAIMNLGQILTVVKTNRIHSKMQVKHNQLQIKERFKS